MLCLARGVHNELLREHAAASESPDARRCSNRRMRLVGCARPLVQSVALRLIVSLRASPDPSRVDAQSRSLPFVRQIHQFGERRVSLHEVFPSDDVHRLTGIVFIAAQATPIAAGAGHEQYRMGVVEHVRADLRGFNAHALARSWCEGSRLLDGRAQGPGQETGTGIDAEVDLGIVVSRFDGPRMQEYPKRPAGLNGVFRPDIYRRAARLVPREFNGRPKSEQLEPGQTGRPAGRSLVAS